MKRTNRQMQAAATKQKIFSHAITLFAANPYEKISVNDICISAGVSIGAFYHHFKNKESILSEGYRLFDESLEQKWNEQRPVVGRQGIDFIVHEQMYSMQEMGAAAAAQYFKNQLTAQEKYILNKDRFFYRAVIDCLREEIKNGRLNADAHTIADDILSLCRGTIYDWCLHSGQYDLIAQGKRVLKMVLAYYSYSDSQKYN